MMVIIKVPLWNDYEKKNYWPNAANLGIANISPWGFFSTKNKVVKKHITRGNGDICNILLQN